MSEEGPVLSERHGAVALITINRPATRNALSSEVAAALYEALVAAAAEREVRAVVLTGAGGAFSAGADLKEGLAPDRRVEEVIKWSTPTFMYKGNIASFSINAKQFVSLMFHKGALIPDAHGLLEGEGKEARVARFEDMADIEAKKKALQSVILAWIQLRDEA